MSDNYFKGWKSQQGDVFKGFLGSLNVYLGDDKPIEDTVVLKYTNEYLVLGFGISLISVGILIFTLRHISKANL
jgi:hypothetical protein